MKYFFFLAVSILLASCRNNNTDSNTQNNILQADLQPSTLSIHEIFDSIQVIPLETTDSCLLRAPVKVTTGNNRNYILDWKSFQVFVFDDEGHFLHTIGKKGQGPGEYREVYDMIVDESRKQVKLLSPFGSLYVYDLEGQFIKQIRLPDKSNYQSMVAMGDKIITWTIPNGSDEPCITIVKADTGEEVNNLWKGPRILNSVAPGNFYTYHKKSYFAPAFHDNEVYEITEDSLLLAYKWNFGEDNIDISSYKFTFTDDNQAEEGRLLTQYLKENAIPYLLRSQYQNEKFFYAGLSYGWFPNLTLKNLFYRKSDGKSFLFKDTQEGILIRPEAFEDGYIMQFSFNEEFEAYQSVLAPEEYQKLMSRQEDDNPCLIKLYFK